jgi:hypothetical protein
MGIKAWLRKILIEEAEKQPPQILTVPQLTFTVDETRHNAVMAILQGRPFFVIYSTPKGITTYTTGLTPAQIRSALDDIAAKVPEMKDVLTDVAIDINAPQNAKQSENR